MPYSYTNCQLIWNSIVRTLSSIWLALVFEDEYLIGDATTADQRRNDGSVLLNTIPCLCLFRTPERLQLPRPWHFCDRKAFIGAQGTSFSGKRNTAYFNLVQANNLSVSKDRVSLLASLCPAVSCSVKQWPRVSDGQSCSMPSCQRRASRRVFWESKFAGLCLIACVAVASLSTNLHLASKKDQNVLSGLIRVNVDIDYVIRHVEDSLSYFDWAAVKNTAVDSTAATFISSTVIVPEMKWSSKDIMTRRLKVIKECKLTIDEAPKPVSKCRWTRGRESSWKHVKKVWLEYNRLYVIEIYLHSQLSKYLKHIARRKVRVIKSDWTVETIRKTVMRSGIVYRSNCSNTWRKERMFSNSWTTFFQFELLRYASPCAKLCNSQCPTLLSPTKL